MMRIHTRVVYDFATGEELEDEFYEYDGPIARAKGGGDTTQTTTVMPPDFQIPFITDVLNQAQGLYAGGAPEYYPGSTVAGVNPTLQSGLDAGTAAAGTAGEVATMGQDALGQLVSGADPLNNPFFSSTLEALLRPATQTFTEDVLPGITGGAVQAGQVGSSRQGVAQGLATDRFTQNILDTSNTFGTNAYQAGLDSLGRAILAAPAIQQMGLVPANTLLSLGGVERGIEQEGINAAIDRFNYEQASPYNALSYYAGLVGNPLGQSSTTVGPDTSPSPLVGAAGGAAAGAGLASGLVSAGAINSWNPAGWAMMAGGALLGSGILG